MRYGVKIVALLLAVAGRMQPSKTNRAAFGISIGTKGCEMVAGKIALLWIHIRAVLGRCNSPVHPIWYSILTSMHFTSRFCGGDCSNGSIVTISTGLSMTCRLRSDFQRVLAGTRYTLLY